MFSLKLEKWTEFNASLDSDSMLNNLQYTLPAFFPSCDEA